MKKSTNILMQAAVCAMVVLVGQARLRASIPPAPSQLAPANGASVVVPFTNSWTAVLDPTAANGGYNWQVSATPDFGSILYQNTTFPSQTQDVLSGLPNGTYYWRVQGVDNGLVAGPWSATGTFTVTGASSAEPVAPVLNPPQAYNSFHPLEAEYWSASTVPGAATYTFEFSTDVNSAISDPSTSHFDNLDTPNVSFEMGPEGNFFMRARAVNANGFKSVPSNVQTFSVFFNNPIGPPPAIVSPVGNPILTLPITFTWTEVPNPQPGGYTIEIADNSNFSTIESTGNDLTDTNVIAQSLTSGTKFWRVFSTQGDSGPNAPANTAFSATGSFTIPNQTAVPVSVTIPFDPFPSGNQTFVAVQLATAPPNGATIQMTSSDPNAIPVPATITMQANIAWMQFQVQAGNVTAPEVVTLTATLNGVSASGSCTVTPPALTSVQITGGTVAGGSPLPISINLNGAAPPNGATVSLSSSSPAVSVPSTFTIQPGFFSGGPSATTSSVTTNTPVTITATYNGVSAQAQVTLAPQIPPASISVCPNALPNGGSLSASGTITFASLLPYQEDVTLTCSDPTDVAVPGFVEVNQGFTSASFSVQAQSTTGTKTVTISASAGGQTQSTTIVLNPTGTEVTASTLTLSPNPVVGGNSTTGTVTLTGPAPAGGAVVSLGAEITSVTVPPTVIIPAGSTSATFPINTSEVGSQAVINMSAECNCGFAFAGLTINPDPATTGANISAFQLNPITVTGGNNSQGKVVLNSAAPSGGAVISLSSANSSVASVPSSVTVPAGATNASFTVRSSSVNSTTVVNLSATYRGVVAPAIITVTGSGGSGPALSSLSLNPTTVVGGNTSQGTVTLTSAAPSGGTVVSLTSGNTSVATVPSSVTVPSGATSANFTVTTVSVSANQSVTISGTLNGTTKSATLTVTPAASVTLSSLTLNPTSVVGGSTSQGTVTLSGAAPSGGTVVFLTSGNTSVATVPSSVTVPSGATSVNFTVTTVSVSANQSVTISGTLNGTTRSATLTVTPAAAVTLSSLTLNPTSVVGGNTSQGTVTLSGVAPAGGAVVSLTSGNTAVATVPSSVTVPAGSTSANFTVTTVSVTANQSVTISGTYNGKTQNATLTVTPAPTVTLSSLTLNPTSVSGGNNSTGTVTLSGPAPSAGAVVTLSSSNTSVATVPSSVTVAAGATTASFTVSTQRVRSNTSVTITGSYNGQNQSATLTVRGGRY